MFIFHPLRTIGRIVSTTARKLVIAAILVSGAGGGYVHAYPGVGHDAAEFVTTLFSAGKGP